MNGGFKAIDDHLRCTVAPSTPPARPFSSEQGRPEPYINGVHTGF